MFECARAYAWLACNDGLASGLVHLLLEPYSHHLGCVMPASVPLHLALDFSWSFAVSDADS